MFWVPPPWHDPEMRKPAWLRRTLTLTTVLTSSSRAAGPASRWGRWGSHRGRRRCWRGGAAGRRSSWAWGKVQLEQLAPKRKVLPRLPTSGCTRDVYSTYPIYPSGANFIFATRCVHLLELLIIMIINTRFVYQHTLSIHSTYFKANFRFVLFLAFLHDCCTYKVAYNTNILLHSHTQELCALWCVIWG